MPGSTPFLSVGLIIIAAVLGALGTFLYESGATALRSAGSNALAYPRIGTGALCYIAVMGLFVAAYRVGGRITVIYPVYASTFVFAAIIALIAHRTPIRPVNLSGMLLLVFGIYLMGRQ